MMVMATVALDIGEVLNRQKTDSIICSALRENNIENVYMVGSYKDMDGKVVTTDFYVDEENIGTIVNDILKENQISEERRKAFLGDMQKLALVYENWITYLETVNDPQNAGREVFEELLMASFA